MISITHEISQSLDLNPPLETRAVFLDISKAFDKVWHDGVIFKLKLNGVSGNALKLIENFLDNRLQRVVLNGQCSSWAKIKAGVPQGSILGPLLFLIYINDISNDIESNVKLFADDTSLFSVVSDPNVSARSLNNDLEIIRQWAFQWKMSFNPDPSKQAHEVIFSRKRKKPFYPDLYFNQSKVVQISSQKHLGLFLDEKLNFNLQLKTIIDKTTKSISVLRKLRFHVPRHSLITIYKSFIRSQLEYADVVYDQPFNESFSNKLENLQYNAALAITGAVRGSSKEKVYQDLGLEYLSSRRWFKRLCLFYKIFNNKTPAYLFDMIPRPRHFLNTRNQHLIPQIFCRTVSFSNCFFPYSINEWNKLDSYITKFQHGFNDTINPFCTCNVEVESISHYYLRCQNYINQRYDLMNELSNIDPRILQLDSNSLISLLLYGNKSYTDNLNSKIIKLSLIFIKSSKRFEGPLF